jgi:ABC-type transporter Mla maintaining outer membrane lipid asymmetry ATPase subunit MlaF
MKGPSGSGKTTLLTLIGALRSSQSGTLKVLNQELVGAKKSDLVKIAKMNDVSLKTKDNKVKTKLQLFNSLKRKKLI